jgi:hypothetical protein
MAIAKLIRKAYPGAYDDMTDAELEARVAKAPGAVRLKLARALMDVQAESSIRDRGLDDPTSPEFRALRERGEMEGTARAVGPTLGILAPAAALHMVPAAVAIRGGGALIGGTEGYRKGGVPGALAGAAVGAVKPGTTGTVGGALQGYESGGVPGAVAGAALGMLLGGGTGQVAREVAALRGAPAAVTRAAVPEVAAARAATAAAPEAAAAAPSAASAVQAQADEIAAQILRWKNEQGFSGAQIVSSLRNVYGITPKDGNKMVQMVLGTPAKAAASPLRGPRIEVGAERVGKGLGLTKEEVRRQTGPIVGEAVGAASPVFPQKAFDAIYEKMIAMPASERLAYAAAAKGEKAMSQVETIRRVLAKQGLIVSAAAIAEAIRRREAKDRES